MHGGREISVRLPVGQTKPLVTSVPEVFHAGVQEVLLTGFVLAVASRHGAQGQGSDGELLVGVEGHGREDHLVDGADLSRTVGWFTSMYPTRLDPGLDAVELAEALAGGPAAGRALKRIKEQLRAVPDSGIGFGLLRYCNPETAAELARLPHPQILFNYLGRFTTSTDADWTPVTSATETSAQDAPHRAVDAQMPAPYSLLVSALISDTSHGPELRVSLAFAEEAVTAVEAQQLMETWVAALDALAAHAADPRAGGSTPSDFPLVPLAQEEIDQLEDEWRTS